MAVIFTYVFFLLSQKRFIKRQSISDEKVHGGWPYRREIGQFHRFSPCQMDGWPITFATHIHEVTYKVVVIGELKFLRVPWMGWRRLSSQTQWDFVYFEFISFFSIISNYIVDDEHLFVSILMQPNGTQYKEEAHHLWTTTKRAYVLFACDRIRLPFNGA